MRSIRSLALGLALSAAAFSAFALLPAIGATTILAPAMRAMLARATEAAVSAVGTTAVRATVAQTAPIAGMGVGVAVSRTIGWDKLLTAGLAAGVTVAGGVAVMDRNGIAITTAGVKMDPGVAPTLTSTTCYWLGGLAPDGGCYTIAEGIEIMKVHTAGYAGCGSYNTCSPVTVEVLWSGTAIGFRGTWTVLNCSGACTSTLTRTYYPPGTKQAAQCPAGRDFAGWDPTKCETDPATWPVVAPGVAVDRLLGNVTPGEMVPLAKDYGDAGVPIPDADAPVTTEGPATVQLPSTTTTTTAPDGTVTQKVVQPVANVTYQGDTITWNITNTTTTTVTVPGQAPQVTVETETPTAGGADPLPVEQEDRECGLPGTPKCMIDETGTPTTFEELPDPDAVLAPLLELPDVADVAWTWSFSLPSSCSVLNVGTFAGKTVTLDLCQWQPMVHSIVGMVWMMLTAFGCIALVGRTLQGS